MILLPQCKPWFFLQLLIFQSHCYFGSLLPRPAQRSLKSLEQVYNLTKTAPVSESRSGLVTVFCTWRNQLVWPPMKPSTDHCVLINVIINVHRSHAGMELFSSKPSKYLFRDMLCRRMLSGICRSARSFMIVGVFHHGIAYYTKKRADLKLQLFW